MRTYRGFEFKRAVTLAIHKICTDIGRNPVHIEWGNIETACINNTGRLMLSNVRDDATLTKGDLMRYVGFGVHELLHWTYTDFDAVSSGYDHSQYLAQLHNALEDAWIEHRAIKASLTGNVEELLSALVNGIVAESLTQVGDWANPAQYPFVLAVYARKHAKIKVPLAQGLEPIFTEAAVRLNTCNDSHQTLGVAVWVYSQLIKLDEPKPKEEPKTEPIGEPRDGDQDGDEDGSGRPSDDPTTGDQEGGVPNPPKDPARSPEKDGKPVEAKPVEPRVDAPEGTGQGGTFSTGEIKPKHFHVRTDAQRIFPINF